MTVVMPVYNGERFVGAAVDSILSQTLSSLSLLIVDDASTDGTPEILRAIALRDPRVVVHRLPSNRGAIGARNQGIGLASTEFVAAMDADDISLPARLEKQVAFLDAHADVGVVGSYVQLIDEHGALGEVKTYPTSPALTAWSLYFFSTIAHPTLMLRRSIMRALVGYSSECKGGTEDFELITRASRITRLANVPEVLLHYRKWAGSMTRTYWDAQEGDASRIVQQSLAEILGPDVEDGTAAALRGLSTNAFPSSAAAIDHVASTVRRLAEAYPRSRGLTGHEEGEIRRDAAVKLWLLASLAITHSPRLSAALSRSAMGLDRGSLVAFMGKAFGRLVHAQP